MSEKTDRSAKKRIDISMFVLHLELVAAKHQRVQADKGVSAASVHSLQLQHCSHVRKAVAAHDQGSLVEPHLHNVGDFNSTVHLDGEIK